MDEKTKQETERLLLEQVRLDKQKAHTEAAVDKLPNCDFCRQDPLVLHQVAHYNGKTKMGPWAYMCNEHFKQYGVGLGLGRGQKLRERR